jgi:hypothetical protein
VKHNTIMSYEDPNEISNDKTNGSCYCPKDCSEIYYSTKVSYAEMSLSNSMFSFFLTHKCVKDSYIIKLHLVTLNNLNYNK